uniref:Putative ovule protein n=1 Tax=Solanum chacoense TaxID=4108 RepID=A0A0V0GK77_SOLCH
MGLMKTVCSKEDMLPHTGARTKIRTSNNTTNSVIALICIHHFIYLPMSILHLNLLTATDKLIFIF